VTRCNRSGIVSADSNGRKRPRNEGLSAPPSEKPRPTGIRTKGSRKNRIDAIRATLMSRKSIGMVH
jgi:hypothetical protein